MYGTESSQAGALAATGTALALGWYVIGAGVLILAGITMLSIIGMIHHQASKKNN